MSVLDQFEYQGLEAIRVGRFNLGINTTFIVYRLGATVFDTGPTNQWRHVKPFIRSAPLRQLILTHHHEDHSGNAAAVKKLTGVTPLAPLITAPILRRGFKIPPIQKVIWGSAGRVEVDIVPDSFELANGESVEAIFAPGHAKDMNCYLLPGRGWLFSADLYIASKLKMLRSDENVDLLLHSISRVLMREFDTIICPHRGVVASGHQRLREKFDYLVDLAAEVQHQHSQGREPEAITRQLLGKENLVGIASRYNFSKINLVRSSLSVDLDRLAA